MVSIRTDAAYGCLRGRYRVYDRLGAGQADRGQDSHGSRIGYEYKTGLKGLVLVYTFDLAYNYNMIAREDRYNAKDTR
jgi:hypothetical protein